MAEDIRIQFKKAGGPNNWASVGDDPGVSEALPVIGIGGATEAKQDESALYKTQAIDDYTTASVTYICKMKADGTWLFTKIDETGNFPTFTYANVSNNATMTTYDLAYADRTTLTYGLLNTLTF